MSKPLLEINWEINWEAPPSFKIPSAVTNQVTQWVESLPLFQAVRQPDLSWFPQALSLAQQYDEVLLLGTGGSSLGGQTLCALQAQPRIHFLENIDPHTFNYYTQMLERNTTLCLVISKSGNTVETLIQFLLCHEAGFRHFLVITENSPNPLRTLAQSWGIPCLTHPAIGGRYACFSLVGLFPATLVGLVAEKFLLGARHYLAQQMEDLTHSLPLLSAAFLKHWHGQGKNLNVMMPYCDRLKPFGRWYSQLWAESLGKNGQGTTPLAALGTVDQHSQLQLFLDGPQDKIFTIITLDNTTPSPLVTSEFATPPLSLLTGKGLNDLLQAEAQATIDVLNGKALPLRTIRLPDLTEESLGALLMHFILEVLAMAALENVDPFDQPAVEEGKRLAQLYLQT